MNSTDKQLVDEIMKTDRLPAKPAAGVPCESQVKTPPRFHSPSGVPTSPSDRRGVSKEEKRLVVDLGITLWRMQKAVMEPEKDRPRRGMKAVARHLNSAWDALHQRGLKVQDHTGCKFDTGQSLTVLAFQPTAGIAWEVVLETVKPTLYLEGTVIQMGEVIVGIPQNVTASTKANANPRNDLQIKPLLQGKKQPMSQ